MLAWIRKCNYILSLDSFVVATNEYYLTISLRFPVVRTIIAKSSSYFNALLGANFREGTNKEIILKGVDGPTLKAILQFIYIGYVELTQDNVEQVLVAASSMEIVGLEKKCAQYLEDDLSTHSCVNSLTLADKYSVEQWRTKAFTFVCKNFSKISPHDFVQIDATIMHNILKSVEIQATEYKIFNCLKYWVEYNEIDRAKFVPFFLKSIRLDLMQAAVYKNPLFNYYLCMHFPFFSIVFALNCRAILSKIWMHRAVD